jgi:hypothetical protein
MKVETAKNGRQYGKFNLKKISRVDLLRFTPIVLIFGVSMTLRAAIPAHVMPGTVNDDLLGVWLANYILHGEWLGYWNIDTLAKPPGYPIFLALCKTLSFNPIIVLHVLYLIISLFFATKIRSAFLPETSRKTNAVLISSFGFLALNPALFADDFSRIYRTSLFTIQVYLFVLFSYFIIRYFQVAPSAATGKNTKTNRLLLLFGFFAGATYGLMSLTRSDSVWILVGPICALFLVSCKRVGRDDIRMFLSRLSISILLVSFFWAGNWIPGKIVKDLNEKYYGVALSEDFFSGEFSRAWKELSRIKNDELSPDFIAVSKKQRDLAYKISPSAASLKPILDGPPNTGWKVYSCIETKVCDDAGGWLPWELRSAAATIHKLSSAQDFQVFFGKMADEIQTACDSNRIECTTGSISTGSKPVLNYDKSNLINNALVVLSSLVTMEQGRNLTNPVEIKNPKEKGLWASVIPAVRNSQSDQISRVISVDFVKTLSRVYSLLCIFFSLLTLVSFMTLKNPKRILDLAWVSTAISFLLYVLVLAFLQSSVGFRVELSLYALPIQPLFLFLILCGFLNFLRVAPTLFRGPIKFNK